MSNNCLKAKSFILLLLMKSNRQKQRFCHPKMADLKAWSHGVRKANCAFFSDSVPVHRVVRAVESKMATGCKFLSLAASCSALTTNFHILVSRGGGWFGISRTIKF